MILEVEIEKVKMAVMMKHLALELDLTIQIWMEKIL